MRNNPITKWLSWSAVLFFVYLAGRVADHGLASLLAMIAAVIIYGVFLWELK